MNPLLGREHILSSLGSHLDATLQGSSSCIIVEGPFGIGKTHLLKATALEAAERGLTVVAGRAGITDQPVLIRLLINFLRHVTAGETDFDDLGRSDRNPFWLMDRVGELVGSAARRHPLVVVLDDAHRIDDVSALALRGLVQSSASSPVLWLLARRPVPARSLARHAVNWLVDHATARFYLGALDNESIAELCTGILGAKPDASVLSWAARCDGNPWLMENVFSALIKAGQMIIVDGSASVVAERLPDGVRTVVRNLLAGMSPAVRQLLAQGTAGGRPFTVEEAAARFGEPACDLSSTVDEAVQVGLIRRDGMELRFAHQVVGEAVAHPGPDTRPERPGPVPPVVTPGAPPPPPPPPPSPSPSPRSSGGSGDEVAARAVSDQRVGFGAEDERAAGFARQVARRNPAVQSLAGGAEHAEGPLRDDPAALLRAADLHRLADGDRIQKELRRLDVPVVRRLGVERPRSGWESLTGAELRVVRAIVDGRTNREAASVLFLSPHTVDSHLRRVFSKLDINSRVELTKHLIAHDAFPPVMAAARQASVA